MDDGAGGASWSGRSPGQLWRSIAATGQEPQRVGHSGSASRVASSQDPHMCTSQRSRHLPPPLYPLVGLDANLRIVPGIAESLEQPDSLTYIFRLRRGVKFHEDRLDRGRREVERRADARSRHGVDPPERARECQIRGRHHSHTIRVNLKQPDAALLATLADRAGMMVSRAAVEKYGKDFARNPVGTGPIQFVEWVKDDHLTVRRFAGYWKSGSALSRRDRLQANPRPYGQADRAPDRRLGPDRRAAPKDVAGTKANPKLRVIETPGLGYRRIELNHTRPPFNNKAIRQAVAWAINREAIQPAVFFNTGGAGSGSDPAAELGLRTPRGLRRDTRPREGQGEARRGWPTERLGFVLKIVNTPVAQKQAEIIQDNLKKVGVDMEIALLKVGAFDEKRRATEFDGAEGLWSGRADPDGNMYAHLITGGPTTGQVTRTPGSTSPSGARARRASRASETPLRGGSPNRHRRGPGDLSAPRRMDQGVGGQGPGIRRDPRRTHAFGAGVARSVRDPRRRPSG